MMINVNVGFMYVMASSCGLKGKTKTPAGKAEGMSPEERMRRGGSSAARRKRNLARKSTAA
ncbi:hypothetical protein [Priestia aryabhattai]|uniref:hypothetical protein n=1 Tax=Priestia aryabhattai TaxID=412384 RepID=UPI003D27E41A